ncbi:MFS transporter [Paenibacillus macquariensis]|uniref:Na+/melibiose symporter n=1 Tax=Paenibacillus macquariensis TaxID=948756 RepID=A0ABY1K5Q1_9BACL|nr:MFS transporter [Paenibacillus macquariensis]MEC0090510.1 MFS transporter [Paenibacillus macquariensis]OAB38511.1 MFS transporter [Paenibacillus macquariensis subsp. macquariensis]SIR30383.1 Na+/melibiose symporter [Paenibacillus macquariensis]
MTESLIKGQKITPLRRLLFGIMFGYGFMMMGFLVPGALLLIFKLIEVDPNGYTSSFGLTAGIAAIFALIGNPLGGALSDRTNNSFGRRRTWILIGPLLGAAMLLWIGFATELWQIVVGWSLAQLFFNFGMAAYTALIPDQVKEEKQGMVSGILGLILPLAMSLGMAIMMLMSGVSSDMKWIFVAVVSIVGPLISLFFIRDGKVEMPKVAKEQISFSEKMSRVYPSPRKFPMFSWAILSKFLMMMGFCSSLYLTVMLVSRMGYTEGQVTSSVATINIISLAAMAFTSIIGGILADKFRKQKPFLYGSAVLMVVGILIFAFVPNYTAYIIASIILGLGAGCFTAVDMALVARILPRKEDAAKDFGLMNVANCLPQSIVPAIAPLLLGIGGWSFFYIALAACVVLGMMALRPLPELDSTHTAEVELTTPEIAV